jgi:hypothetical protein
MTTPSTKRDPYPAEYLKTFSIEGYDRLVAEYENRNKELEIGNKNESNE